MLYSADRELLPARALQALTSSSRTGASPQRPTASGQRGPEAVAHATHRLDVRSCRAELLAQALHVRIDRSVRDLDVQPPDVVEELLAGLHPLRAQHERTQELELQRGQAGLRVADPDLVLALVQADAAAPEHSAVPRSSTGRTAARANTARTRSISSRGLKGFTT